MTHSPNPIRSGLLTALALWALAALALRLLAGCTPLSPANLPPDDARAVAAFAQAWSEAGLPSLAGCHVEDVRVVHTATAAQFAGLCGALPASGHSGAYSCLSQGTQQVGLAVEAYPVAVLDPGLAPIDTTGGPIVHELCHAASACVLGSPDPRHTDPRLWTAAPGATLAQRTASVQGRARVILGYPAPQ